MPNDYRPVKVVFPSDGDFFDPNEKPRGFEPLCTVNRQYRATYVRQVDTVRSTFSKPFEQDLPAVAKVTLKEKARSKSYRPQEVFNEDTCPIIGLSGAGGLLASVTPSGLDRLKDRIQTAKSKVAISHLSTLDAIAPYSAEDSYAIEDEKQINETGTPLRVKLFRHGNPDVDAKLDDAFMAYARTAGVRDVRQVNYGSGTRIFRCSVEDKSVAENLARFVGAQSVCTMPVYNVVRTTARELGPIDSDLFPPPDPEIDYPVVGIFDSGTDPNNELLQRWVVDRYDWRPPEDQDNSHGSFVAGLIANGRNLNSGHLGFPNASAKIVDVVVFDDSLSVEESDLVTFIDDALQRFPHVKVWNLSLALAGIPCAFNRMSELGAALDDMQNAYGVLFVQAAGNIASPPLREWPVESGYSGQDRLAPPADSYRSLTVGGMAHLDNAQTCVRCEEASPFSLKGPGVGAIPKPEVSHYAGNCDSSGNYIQTGIVSIGNNSKVVEDIGVSFATPLVTVVSGNVDHELRIGSDETSAALVKALVVHSAFFTNGPINPDHFEYTGCGRPAEIDDILNCRSSSATVIFQIPVTRRPRFYKHDFPMPECLQDDGVLKCEVFMTLLYDPPLDRQYDLEYCRRTVSASLGVMKWSDKEGKEVYDRQVEPAPHQLHQRYSKELSDLGLSWSPTKLYYRKFSRARTVASLPWRLSLKVLNRAECTDESPLPVSLIVTVRAQDPEVDVYTEMVRAMEERGWTVSNLELRSRGRFQE